ncbi:MAG: amidohydrolase family protein [Methylobacteriaceae bacterium]|nr:amidohydrolase family protein [Methylobacteriaceae bacterium]MBV9246025.1 amidohydrolase family protein [Methylobacteriaceae bacterium]
MLTRRSVLAQASALCVVAAGAGRTIAAGPRPQTTATFEVPRGACDAHVHVIGDPRKFPMSAHRDYTPPAATADELLQVLKFLNLDRVVIVTPTIYDDNAATLAAIRLLGRERARGIAFVEQTMPSEFLDSLRDSGVAGVRLFLTGDGPFDPERAVRHLENAIDLAKPRSWHLQISTPPDVIGALLPQLAASPVPIVLDYFGWVEGGVEQPGFDAILSLLRSGRAYIKFAEAYRLSKRPPDYPDLVPVIRAILEANTDRVLWGSGWPHVSGSVAGRAKTDLAPNLPVDPGHLLNLLSVWVPDADTRRKILVDNPARLYGF